MAWVPSGIFYMGSPTTEGSRNADETRHKVTLTKGFYIAHHELAQYMYEEVMGAGSDKSEYGAAYGGGTPVDKISWHETLIYCNTRSIQEGYSPVYTMYKSSAPNAGTLTFNGNQVVGWTDIPENWSTDTAEWGSVPTSGGSQNIRWGFARMIEGADGYRLPTEAEWECACRAGTQTPYALYSHYDSSIPKEIYGTTSVNNNTNGAFIGPQSSPISPYNPLKYLYGTYETRGCGTNEWGLTSAHGNVAEWVWDWYGGDYGTADQEDPKGNLVPIGGQYYKILRGGSLANGLAGCRSASRERVLPYLDRGANSTVFSSPSITAGLAGFRVVRYIKQ
jgi:formylglycine-generating enzyme required for sulfatase activity